MAANYGWIINLFKSEKKAIIMMDNLDIFIYTGVIFVAFISFSILTFKELSEMSESIEKSTKKEDNQNK
tara:strand:- start:2963 stop:3169 length:207 start_codon:yes stop_codon:yes gene_type:complete